MIIYLTAEDVADLVCSAYPGSFVADWGLLEGGVARPQAGTADGTPFYQTLHEKAAALLDSLARTQPFNDGNKRAAAMATKAMLDINGWTVDCDEMDYAHLVLDVAEGIIVGVSKIAEQLKQLTRPAELPDLH